MQMTTRRRFCVACAAWLALAPLAAAQRRLWRIGYHSAASAQSNPGWLDAFRKGMAELGWSESRDYVIDARYADGNAAAVPRLAAELVATRPDVLLTTAGASIKALGQATSTIPIVFAVAADPVAEGFATSLRRPGRNLTGLTSRTRDLAAKRLQLLKDAFPATSHVAVLFQAGDSNSVIQVADYQDAASRLKMRITPVELRQEAEIESAVRRAGTSGADAYAISPGFLIGVHRNAVAQAILRSKAPSIASNMIMVEAGILMAYTPSIPDNFRRAAAYVDKILKGASPADLAIEEPSKFEFVVNTRTARALGVDIPASLLQRADRIIE